MNELHEKTLAHLLLADENFDTARRLILLDPLPVRWVAVVAFYAAVHYLGAYFHERENLEVTSHRHRARLIRSDPDIREIHQYYDRLYRLSLIARYQTRFHASEAALEELLDVDLVMIRDSSITLMSD